MLIRNIKNAETTKTTEIQALFEGIKDNIAYKTYKNKLIDSIENAYVAFIDIASFSSKIKNWKVADVTGYLNRFYNSLFPIIKKYNGQIDKIMGDGIIIIFSDSFNLKSENSAAKNCLYCCKCCIESLCNTDFEIKASIGSGKVFFNRLHIDDFYDEISCIGHPMTIAFRLENEAEKNQILIYEDDVANENESEDEKWSWFPPELIDLKGLDNQCVRRYQYNEGQNMDDDLPEELFDEFRQKARELYGPF